MQVTAADAKNRLGQLLESAQHEAVVIEQGGRKHSVVISYERYQRLIAAEPRQPQPETAASPRTADEFYGRYKDWVDEQNRHFEAHGIWNEEFRTW